MPAPRNKTGPQNPVDPKWTAVDEYTFPHVHNNSPSSQPSVEVLEKAYAHQAASGLPDIAVSPNQGKYLQVQARIAHAKNILELGTLGGYSTLFLVHAFPDTRVTSVEYESHHGKVARENFEAAGVADRITVLEGAGVDVLPGVLAEVKEGKLPVFDFVFIDADKVSNWIYFQSAVQMTRPGGVIIVDNVIRYGALVDEARFEEENVRGSREVIENAGKDERVDCSILQTVGDKNYDGMLVCVVRGPT